MMVKLITHTPLPEHLVAVAARICYSAEEYAEIDGQTSDEKRGDMIRMLEDMGHESPFEHVSFTFEITGVSRSLLAQLTRHRIASYSVRSQRYVAEDHFEYIVPPEIRSEPEALAKYTDTMRMLRTAYSEIAGILRTKHEKKLLQQGKSEKAAAAEAGKAAIEDARFILPNAVCTHLIMTINARSLLNFLSLRCCMRAQWEIRELAWEMLRLVREAAPALFEKAGPSCVRGQCREGKFSCGRAAETRARAASVTESLLREDV